MRGELVILVAFDNIMMKGFLQATRELNLIMFQHIWVKNTKIDKRVIKHEGVGLISTSVSENGVVGWCLFKTMVGKVFKG